PHVRAGAPPLRRGRRQSHRARGLAHGAHGGRAQPRRHRLPVRHPLRGLGARSSAARPHPMTASFHVALAPLSLAESSPPDPLSAMRRGGTTDGSRSPLSRRERGSGGEAPLGSRTTIKEQDKMNRAFLILLLPLAVAACTRGRAEAPRAADSPVPVRVAPVSIE